MTNKQLAKQLRSIGNSLFDTTYDPNNKLLLDEASDRLENQGAWISVDERLPDEDGEYLTWNGIIYFLIYFNASLGLWNVSEGCDTSSAIRDVTHWMPLPEAPKMKGCVE